jgi:hypothetical protein
MIDPSQPSSPGTPPPAEPYWSPWGATSPTGPPGWPTAPPTVPAAAQAPHRGRRLRAAGWVLVVVSFVGGLLTFGFGTYRVVRSMADLQRVPAAIGGPVTIDSPGVYTIYYEPGALARSGPNESDPGVQVVGPDHMVATVTPPEGRFSYSLGDRAGHKIAELTADQPGQYQIESLSADLASGELAVGGNLGGRLTWAFVAAGVAFVAFLAGLALLIVGYVQRRPRP